MAQRPSHISATAAGPAAVAALVAASVSGHDGAALGATRSVGGAGLYERELLLRIRFGRTERRRLAGLRDGVLRSQEARPQPAEHVIHDRFGVGNLRIPGPAARLEPDVRKLVDEELERH